MNPQTNRKHDAARIALATVAVLCLALAPAAAAQDVAQVRAGSSTIDFNPVVAHGGLVLTVSGPDGFHHRAELGPGEAPSFSIFDQAGGALPDGSYKYELRVTPTDVQRREALEANRLETRAARQGIEPLVQSGSFAVIEGAIVAGGETEPDAGPGPAGGNVLATKDQVIVDDLIVQRSLCVGFDCVNGESFGFDTIRLKENNTRIKFEDTSAGSFPSSDWELTANDSASGGLNRFSILDVDNARNLFTVEAGASANSLYVDSSSRIGLRTSTPVLDLHIATSNTPGLRLEQTNAGGFTAQSWDIAGNEANFFVRDVTGGSRLPLRIRPGAPTSSLDIAASGNVGVGTASPTSKLDVASGVISVGDHIVGERSGQPEDLVIEATDDSFFMIDSDNNTTGARFFVSKDGDLPSVLFQVRENGTAGINRNVADHPLHVGSDATNGNGAHVTVDGIWTDGSSRVNKTGIRGLELDEAIAAFQELEPVRYFGKNSPSGEEYLGFIAEDVPDLVAMKHRKGLSPMDIVALLTKVSQEQQRVVDEQGDLIRQLVDRVAELEGAARVDGDSY